MAPTVHEAFRMVADLDRSVDFYRTLGLSLHEQTDRRAEFDTGECTFVVEEAYDPETLAEWGLDPPGDEPGRGVILVLLVDSVTKAAERAEEAGATVLTPPRETDWGEKLALVADPDGYVVELVRPL